MDRKYNSRLARLSNDDGVAAILPSGRAEEEEQENEDDDSDGDEEEQDEDAVDAEEASIETRTASA